MDPLSDNELMMKVKSGDIARLGLLFERHHRKLFGFFYRSTGQQALSEDLVQNVFEKILKHRKQFKGFGRFTTWMFSIAHNELVDHYKKNRRKPEEKMIKDEEVEQEEVLGYLEKECIKEELDVLDIAMKKLDDEKRQLLALSKCEGMSFREIAEVMKISENNARVKTYRALKELRNIYRKIEKQVLS